MKLEFQNEWCGCMSSLMSVVVMCRMCCLVQSIFARITISFVSVISYAFRIWVIIVTDYFVYISVGCLRIKSYQGSFVLCYNIPNCYLLDKKSSFLRILNTLTYNPTYLKRRRKSYLYVCIFACAFLSSHLARFLLSFDSHCIIKHFSSNEEKLQG